MELAVARVYISRYEIFKLTPALRLSFLSSLYKKLRLLRAGKISLARATLCYTRNSPTMLLYLHIRFVNLFFTRAGELLTFVIYYTTLLIPPRNR